jgi:hypothetical protein
MSYRSGGGDASQEIPYRGERGRDCTIEAEVICNASVEGPYEFLGCHLPKGHSGPHSAYRENGGVVWVNTNEPNVDHPAHYGGDVVHETIKCLNAWGLEGDALLWNAAKYISRAGKKGDLLEDLKKAAWYLARRIEELEKV